MCGHQRSTPATRTSPCTRPSGSIRSGACVAPANASICAAGSRPATAPRSSGPRRRPRRAGAATTSSTTIPARRTSHTGRHGPTIGGPGAKPGARPRIAVRTKRSAPPFSTTWSASAGAGAAAAARAPRSAHGSGSQGHCLLRAAACRHPQHARANIEDPSATTTPLSTTSKTVATPSSAMAEKMVEGRDLAEVLAVLGEDRLVVARLLLGFLELLRRQPGAERCRDRVARRHPHQQEDDGQQDQDGRHRERRAASAHRRAASSDRLDAWKSRSAPRAGTAVLPMVLSPISQNRKMNDGSNVSSTPLTPSRSAATWSACQIGIVGASSRRDLLDLVERLLTRGRVVGRPSPQRAACPSRGCRSGC